MPAQIERLDPRVYRLRHIGPAAALYPPSGTGAPASTTVFGQALTFRELPISHQPSSPDFVDGTWTLRLGDAGEWSITFPNAAASDGLAWRSRFDPSGRKQFIEIYRADELEFVGVILKVVADRKQVVVSGQDGLALLHGAYEHDSGNLVMAPRDWAERYSRLWVPVMADDFNGNALSGAWSTIGGPVVTVANGQVAIQAPSAASIAGIYMPISISAGDEWSVTARLVGASPVADTFGLLLLQSGGNDYAWIEYRFDSAAPLVQFVGGATIPIPATSQYPAVLTLEGVAGRWIRAYCNGQLIGFTANVGGGALTVPDTVQLETLNLSTAHASASWDFCMVRKTTGHLIRGAAPKGDYVLPGAASAYPWGGLHGRYYNDGDLSGLVGTAPNQAIYKGLILSPSRKSYADRQDATINDPVNPTPGAATTYWSARWFGTVYLQLSRGDYGIRVANLDDGARVWVGKTKMGDQIIDDWNFGGARTVTGTISSSGLGAKDGWYPIIVEYFNGAGAGGIELGFSPPGSSTYTDPGGGTVTNGSYQIIPATSLSPLGCVDQRAQGQSHFDLFQKGCTDYGYQFAITPQQLESGLFPATAAPLLRVGRDTDVILEPDDTDTVEALLNYSNTLDATDQLTSIRGNGAGVQDGSIGQLQSEAISIPDLLAALYDIQAWQDNTDVAFASLLAAKLGSMLGLRVAPWQNVQGDPAVRDRLADTFPLTGALAKAKLLPGDGLRLKLADVNVIDANPRQILQLTRTFGSTGRTGARAGFRQRPRDPVLTMRDLFYAATRVNRTKQGQYVNLQTPFTTETVIATATSSTQKITLQPGDQVVSAELRVTRNTNSQALGILINGIDRASQLVGAQPVSAPMIVALNQYAQTYATNNDLEVALKNNGGSGTTLDWQVFVTVLR